MGAFDYVFLITFVFYLKNNSVIGETILYRNGKNIRPRIQTYCDEDYTNKYLRRVRTVPINITLITGSSDLISDQWNSPLIHNSTTSRKNYMKNIFHQNHVNNHEKKVTIESREKIKSEPKLRRSNKIFVDNEDNDFENFHIKIGFENDGKKKRSGKNKGKRRKGINSMKRRNKHKKHKKVHGRCLHFIFGWGRRSCGAHTRIIGGASANSIEDFPYMAYVDVGCGGSIIGHQWVVSAAHCYTHSDDSCIHVGSIDAERGCLYEVGTIYIHPEYTADILQNDIALLRIHPDIIYSPAVQPIKITESPARYSECGVISGWGAAEYQGQAQRMLKYLMLPVIANDKCWYSKLITGQFCAGYRRGGQDVCHGDSGSPFVVDGQLVGIASFGGKCAHPGNPSGFTDVYYYRTWIHGITGIS